MSNAYILNVNINFNCSCSPLGGRSVGIVRSRTKGHGVFFFFVCSLGFALLWFWVNTIGPNRTQQNIKTAMIHPVLDLEEIQLIRNSENFLAIDYLDTKLT
jgi:hypothetical protein